MFIALAIFSILAQLGDGMILNKRASKENGRSSNGIRIQKIAKMDGIDHQMVRDENKTLIRISPEAGDELLQHWANQAMSGLMAAVAAKKIRSGMLTRRDKLSHNNCTNEAQNLRDHANCVVELFHRTKLHYLRNAKNRRRRRVKREIPWKIETKSNFELIDEKKKSPLALIAQQLTKLLHEEKKKSNPKKVLKNWKQVLDEIKAEIKERKKKKKAMRRIRKKFENYSRMMRGIGVDPKSGFEAMGIEEIIDDDENGSDEMLPKNMTDEQKAFKNAILTIREGVKLGLMLNGTNTTNFDERKIAIFSPQFMSVFPDEHTNQTVNLLSPSVLALHEQGSDLEKNLSLAKTFRIIAESGQEDWMNFVFEASGVTEAVERMKEQERKEEEEVWQKRMHDENGKPLYFTKENVTEMYGEYEASKVDRMKLLHKSLTNEQLKELNSTGFAVMTPRQLHVLYGPGSPYNDSKALENFRNLSRSDVGKLLEANIKLLAKEENAFKISKRDIVLSPVVFSSLVLAPDVVSQSIVLSPLVFSPLILSPSALGPLILSPWIFSPLILSPRVLGPIILSPTIFSPIILSPMCLGPLILSPAVADPLILSPFVLNPFILTPLVMVPVILNPFCLSPLLGVPNTLSPLILSPFVLSPFIFSPPFVNAFVLSPYALSPILLSDGQLFTAVLSPSWLSSL
ncbi:unnamed protein product [Caenorhabditis bovis]|uniref:Uncharacterized protein n=1 Tax=Caenorhabditis bovis TaxID=2654633 RepID=A0A8S1ECN4_9PELO|nr:unnamed protein product [Caenorhabditis bovis]